MTNHCETIRFEPERTLIGHLFERYGLEDILEHYIQSEEVAPYYELVLGTQLRLTPVLAPRLHSLLGEVQQRLHFTEPVDLFVQPNPEINAFALHSVSEGHPHVVSVTSGLVERMNDDELRFVLGHELGHLAYRHYRSRLVAVAIGEDETGQTRIPALLVRRLESWDRLAELSADRAGHAAALGDLQAIVSAFFKMASGLGPEHLRFDIGAFLSQLEDLQKMARRDVLARFSHPVTPVRVRALQLFDEIGGFKAKASALRKVDAAVAEVARLMDFEMTEPIGQHARDFLLAGGLLAAHADGTPISSDQIDLLLHLLLPLTDDPEAEIARCHSAEEAAVVLEDSASWLQANAGEERFILFEELAHLVALDGHLHTGEQTFMMDLAARLGIPRKSAKSTLYEVLTAHLQTRAAQERMATLGGFG